MKCSICFLFVCIFHFISVGQNTYSNIVKPRLSFISDKTKATDTSEFVVINSNDTLYAKYPFVDLSFLDESNYTEKNVMGRYKSIVFQYTNAKSKKPYEIKQWNTPIIVFLDKRFPKSVIKKFEDFYSQIKGIPNLNISFTNRLEDSNYYIKTTSKEINGYGSDFTFHSEEDRINSALTGGTYLLQTDKNNKFFIGVLTVNTQNKSEFILLKQIKQLFFMSLGHFAQEYLDENNHVINEYYDNSDTISNFDLEILKIHYSIIYDRHVNGTDFKELIKLSKSRQ